MKKTKTGIKQKMDSFIANIIIFMALFIAADLFTILYFKDSAKIAKPEKEATRMAEIVAEEYVNPEDGKLKTLKTGGEFERKMPVFSDKLKFKLTYDPVLAGPNELHVLQVCCPAGYSKEYYTAKMPWAFLLYEFEPGLPTVVLFDIDKKAKKARFEIVILDKMADESSIKAVAVTVFMELIKQYLTGYAWSGNVRKELM